MRHEARSSFLVSKEEKKMLNVMFRVAGIVLILIAIFLVSKKSFQTGNTAVQGVKKTPLNKKAVFALIGSGVLCLLFSLAFTIIPTGYTGVRVTFGQVEEHTLSNGINFQIPLVQEIVLVNNKQQDIKFNENTISSETSERNTVNFQGITVTYQINPQKSAWIYANVTNYEAGLVNESLVASAIKTTSKTLSPNDCTNRSIIEPKAKENIQKSLDEKYGPEVVYVNKVVINNATFDTEYDEKIAKKQQAQIDYETQQIENKKTSRRPRPTPPLQRRMPRPTRMRKSSRPRPRRMQTRSSVIPSMRTYSATDTMTHGTAASRLRSSGPTPHLLSSSTRIRTTPPLPRSSPGPCPPQEVPHLLPRVPQTHPRPDVDPAIVPRLATSDAQKRASPYFG